MEKHRVPELSYSYDSLEPYIDAQTMEIHHTKHHQAYVNNLNAALEKHPELGQFTVDQLLANMEEIPEDILSAVRNHGGGHANHSFFWPILKKGVQPEGPVVASIIEQFGGIAQFQEQFSQAAVGLFGSGWAWLVMSDDGMSIMTTANQDSPLMAGKTPLIGLDVWEHAYYLKYQNRRPEYVENFFKVINWEKVNELYLQVRR